MNTGLVPPVDEKLLEEDPQELYEAAPCGYLSTLPDGTIVKANRTFLDWTGFQPADLIGRRRFQDLLTMPGRIYYETHFGPLLAMQGFVNEVALDVVCANGARLPVFANSVHKKGKDGTPLLIRTTVFNAIDRRRYERELLEARRTAEAATAALETLNAELEARVAAAVEERMQVEEALRQSQKMEAVGQLTGGVAHDFNNLLTVIMGGLETIDRQLALMPEEERPARIERAQRMAMMGAKRAATLTKRLLAFSRRQPLEPKPVDIGRLISGLSDLLQRTLGETVELETVLAARTWPAMVDTPQLENAIVNLAVNARDAMPDGGRLTIETANVCLDDDYVEQLPETVPAGQYVRIAVSDTGSGMDAEILERVFEPFFTTKEAGKGTGLGLSQVYGFVRQSGGHVRIYSEVGVGTTVKVYLPRLTGQAEVATEMASNPATRILRGDETVLLVEDHEDLRTYAAGILRELGYRVLEAADGPAALDLLATSKRIDLLFTDVVLAGGMNGRQLADEAVRMQPDLRLLYTTGNTRNAIVHNGTLAPGVQLLSKPFSFEELAAKVRAVLDA